MALDVYVLKWMLTALRQSPRAKARAVWRSLPVHEVLMHLVMLATKASLVQRHLVSLMELQLPMSGLAIQVRAQAEKEEDTTMLAPGSIKMVG